MSDRTLTASRDALDEQVQHALGLAYRHLSRRDRTMREMRAHLNGKGVEPEAAETAIGVLSEQGYLDDVRFARLFTADKRELEQWGCGRIRRALLWRGVDSELVEGALACDAGRPSGTARSEVDAVQSPGDPELGRALALLHKRFENPPRERRERDRALGLLLRKGYEEEVALEALAIFVRPRS